jgi:hypothetical protein
MTVLPHQAQRLGELALGFAFGGAVLVIVSGLAALVLGGARQAVTTIVRFLPPISGRLIRSRRLRPDSDKTYGNPVRRTACQKADEFPVPASAALIGRFSVRPRKRMS